MIQKAGGGMMGELFRFPLESLSDATAVGDLARDVAREAAIPSLEQAKLGTVVLGLARRCLVSAGAGEVIFSVDHVLGAVRLVVTVTDGHKKARKGAVKVNSHARLALGLEMASLRRLVDDFEQAANADGSTRVTAGVRISAAIGNDSGLVPRLTALKPSMPAARARSDAQSQDAAALLETESKILEVTQAELARSNTERIALMSELALTNRGVLNLVAELSAANDSLTISGAALRAIIATAGDGFVSMDSEGLITEWNHRAEALFGWPRDEVIGRELVALIIGDVQREVHRAVLRHVLEGDVQDQIIEVSALHRDGHEVPVELAVWRVSSGRVEQISAFIRDLSERHKIARDVALARDQALEATRLKSLFLATMSHEIRTPMNGVIGLTGLLLLDDLTASQHRYVEGIQTAGNVLLAVINNILDFSKIEAGALVLDDTAINVCDILGNVIDLVGESAHAKDLELSGYCDPTVPTLLRGDPIRIRQILLNLATNAVKFTSQGKVSLTARLDSRTSTPEVEPVDEPDVVQIRFEVTDTGIGIEPDDRARLFDAFSQADASTTRNFGGTGLGLAICRELAEAMGGRVGVEGIYGKGSTFWCTIPLRNNRTLEEMPASRDASPDGRRVPVAKDIETYLHQGRSAIPDAVPVSDSQSLGRLLVVDDNEINQMVAVGILNQLGYAVDVAKDGLEALGILANTTYRAVLMDCQMPRMDGYEATVELRSREAAMAISGVAGLSSGRRMPIIAMTASAMTKDRDRCLAAGMDDYVTKPIHPSELAAALTRWITPDAPAEPEPAAHELATSEPKPPKPAGCIATSEVTTTEDSILQRLDELREDGTSDLVSRLVPSFLNRAPNYLSELTATLGRADLEAFAQAAHSLCGASSNLGAMAMSSLCLRLEDLGRQGRAEQLPDLLTRLNIEYDHVRNILEGIAA